MLILQPDPSEIGVLVTRMEAEASEFMRGIESSGDHDEDDREHTEYAATLRSGAVELQESGRWVVFQAERRHARAFFKDAAADALNAGAWPLLSCYAECLRRLEPLLAAVS